MHLKKDKYDYGYNVFFNERSFSTLCLLTYRKDMKKKNGRDKWFEFGTDKLKLYLQNCGTDKLGIMTEIWT